MTKNITLAIDEDLLDKVRVLAAMRRTSVNAMVREFLAREVDAEKQKDATKEELLKLMEESEADFGDRLPTREETYSGLPRFDRFND